MPSLLDYLNQCSKEAMIKEEITSKTVKREGGDYREEHLEGSHNKRASL